MKLRKLKSMMWSRVAILVLALLLGAFTTADAQDTWTSGECTVAVNGGSLNVTKANGNGRMADYDVQDGNEPGWYAARKKVSVIVIEEGVTSIGTDCFRDFENATIVILAEGLTSIGKESFVGCRSLGSIVIPSTVTNIGPDAFYLCHPSLLNVYCYADPAKLTWIDNGSNDFTWFSAENLKTSACHVRGADLATYKAKFADVNITFLGDLDYKDDSWQSGDCWVTLDDDGTLTITNMEGGEGRMDDYQDYRRSPWYKYASKVKSVVIGEGVTVIGKRAFDECVNLETVTLPEGVTTINADAFIGCTGLKTVTIPSTVSYIDVMAFGGCSAVDDLYLYPLPTDLEWWMTSSELKPNKGTRCHVKAGYQRTYESTYSQYNVTFVGDLPDDNPGLAIDATNFPDANFRQLVHDLQENNGDDYLNYDEISSIEILYASGYEIKDLKGVEHFRELKRLYCSGNQLTTLNLSGNTKLQSLNCTHNQLTTLRLSACANLTSLECSYNQLTTLDVSQNPRLNSIDCTFNQIKGLGMDAFASSLRADGGGRLYFLAEKDSDGNDLTLNQLRIVRSKGWTVYYQKASSEFDWIVYEGEQYTIKIAGTQVTDMNKDDVLGDGSVKYEPGDGVGILTLTSNKLTAPDHTYIIIAQGVDLVINAPEDGLTLESQYGIDMRGNNLTVNGDITFKTEFDPVYSCADFIVNGNLTATNVNIDAGSVIVNGNTKMSSVSGTSISAATSVVLNGTKHELSGGACIRATNVTIAGDLTATASGNCAIWANDNLTMASGTWTVSANNSAIRCGKKFTIPDTHGIKSPTFGRIGTISDYISDYQTVLDVNDKVAKHVEIVDYPCLYLYDNKDCSSQLSAADGQKSTVALNRTLYKNGWNSFAAPFAITDLEGTFGQGVKVRQLISSTLTGGTLKLTFADADRIEPGKPYLVRVNETVNLTNHLFENVTVSKDIVPTVTDAVDLIPTLSMTTVEGDPKSVMVLFQSYGLVFAQELPAQMRAFRAYFRLKDPDAVRSISMNLDDGGATLVNSERVKSEELTDTWFTVDGRKLSGRPTAKGVYIYKGKKTIIK